jgi:hypothetical protein
MVRPVWARVVIPVGIGWAYFESDASIFDRASTPPVGLGALEGSYHYSCAFDEGF